MNIKKIKPKKYINDLLNWDLSKVGANKVDSGKHYSNQMFSVTLLSRWLGPLGVKQW